MKTYTTIRDLPRAYLPQSFLKRPDTIIPAPALDMKSQPLCYTLSPALYQAWQQAMDSSDLFIAHALSIRSQRRILNAYFTNAQILDTKELLIYSPFTLLAVRQFISGSFINVHENKSSKLTRNSIGFLLKIPPTCLHSIYLMDADTPQEQEGISQQSFRNLIFEKDNKSAFFLNQSTIHLTPQDLLKSIHLTYNEVAFIPRTLNPSTSMSLYGIFINEALFNMDIQGEKEAPVNPDFYYQCAKDLSKDLQLPLIYLRK